MAKKGCKICLCQTQELDSTGRCPSCAAVKAAKEAGISYGEFMVQKYTREAQNGEERLS